MSVETEVTASEVARSEEAFMNSCFKIADEHQEKLQRFMEDKMRRAILEKTGE